MEEKQVYSKNIRATFDSTHFVLFLFKWRKLLFITTLIGAVASVIVSLLIHNVYRSTVILFPTTTSSISKALLAENPGSKQDILQFGQEEEAEQMIQVLNSDNIRDMLAKKWKLYEHYGIGADDKFRKTLLIEEYNGKVKIQRTEYMSVKVDVLDENPDYAAGIANDIASLYDSTMTKIRRERAEEGLRIVRESYANLMQEIELKQDSLNKLMKLGVNDYESQAERLNEALGRAITEGKTQAAREVEDRLKVLSTYGPAYIDIRDNLIYLRKQLAVIRTKYEEARVDAERALTNKFVVDAAVPSEKKAYPIRWLIVVLSTVATFLLSVLIVIAIENFGKLKNNA